jgi:hypothetical protein
LIDVLLALAWSRKAVTMAPGVCDGGPFRRLRFRLVSSTLTLTLVTPLRGVTPLPTLCVAAPENPAFSQWARMRPHPNARAAERPKSRYIAERCNEGWKTPT